MWGCFSFRILDSISVLGHLSCPHVPSLSKEGFTQLWKAPLVHYCLGAFTYSMEMVAINHGGESNSSQQSFRWVKTTPGQLHPRLQHMPWHKFKSTGSQLINSDTRPGYAYADCSKFLWKDLQVLSFSPVSLMISWSSKRLHISYVVNNYPWSLLHPWVSPSFLTPTHCSNTSWGSLQMDAGFAQWLKTFKRWKFSGLFFRVYPNVPILKMTELNYPYNLSK